VEECDTPKQSNNYDCGVFAIGFAEALTSNKYTCITLNDTGTGTDYNSSQLQQYFEDNGEHETFASNLRATNLKYISEHLDDE